MNQEKTVKFIAEKRKEKSLTKQELPIYWVLEQNNF